MKYIFKKEKYIEVNGMEDYKKQKAWIDYCDREEADFSNEDYTGYGVITKENFRRYVALKVWCEVVEE